ncbi:MAG: radical SAM/SPASM domain-containing protein [Patescibacteria group bacterium]
MIKKFLFKKNQHQLKQSYLKRKVISQGQPNVLIIEPTNYCNLSCRMCPRRLMTRPEGFMTLDLFKKIIDQAPLAEWVWLHFFGEPLFNQEIFAMIDYAKSKKIKLGLSTNATILDQEKFDKILQAEVEIFIINTYQSYQQTKDVALKETEALIQLLKVRRKNQTKIIIQGLDDGGQYFLDIKKQFKGFYQVFPFLKNFHSWANQVDEINDLKKIDKTKINQAAVCFEPWRQLVITWNGTVLLCCNDYNAKMVLGNINFQTLAEIWNGQSIQAIRNSFIKGNYQNDLCRFCQPPDFLAGKNNPFKPYQYELKAYGLLP